MSQDLMEYAKMMEDAVRGVMREALVRTAADGLPGLHHFYITFQTTAPGVTISDHLHAQHPEEMTIVIEHQFWDLEVTEKGFSITLAFGGTREPLRIPFEAVTAFVDPSVKFGLQFGAHATEQAAGQTGLAGPTEVTATPVPDEVPGRSGEKTDKPEDAPGGGTVIALDRFRKK
jgi:hypothetical protein